MRRSAFESNFAFRFWALLFSFPERELCGRMAEQPRSMPPWILSTAELPSLLSSAGLYLEYGRRSLEVMVSKERLAALDT